MTDPELPPVVDSELVSGPTAGQFDVWARVAGLGILIGLVIGVAVPVALGIAGTGALVFLVVLVVVPAVLSTAFSLLSLSTAKRERAAGYSTMYDFRGFALRDPRTREVIRPADVAPSGTVRRSLFRAMLTVKPGTLLAKRLEEDDADELDPPQR